MKVKTYLLAGVAIANIATAAGAQTSDGNLIAAAPPVARPATPATAAPAGLAAEVNEDKFTVAELNRMVDAVKEQDPALKTDSAAAKQALATIRTQILDNWVETRLLAQEAKRRNIKADSAQLDKLVADVRSEFKTEKEFTDWLKQDGKTAADLRQTLADEMMIRELARQITVDIVVTNEDIAQYYRQNLDKFAIPEAIKAHHILLAVNPNAPTQEKERVRKRAADLIRQINNGGDFETIAKTNTDDPGTRDAGGDLGSFGRNVMVKPFEDAAFKAEVGKIVGPVETDFGFHIIRVDEKLPPRTVPLTEVQANPQMKALMLKRKVQGRLDELVNKLKASGKVRKYVS